MRRDSTFEYTALTPEIYAGIEKGEYRF